MALARPFCAPALLIVAASALGGCSFQLGSLMGNGKDDTTASIPPNVAEAHASANAALSPSEADLAYARVVATEALARGTKDSSHPWENPNTGARGTVTATKVVSRGYKTTRTDVQTRPWRKIVTVAAFPHIIEPA